ncbi:DUF6194 family protein [Nonomuraea gerenzanensis]|uniref:DUF6194 domain-containing protein n=1 Tax=Nonomuraea gerenzanensis TaxID=93944 RepID=A0A1M4E4B0_9ACTN|nr:DUF6194 family protein [Nonomuraea gerenzanensis]UBU15833.1 DUF6194 family protein [Nonomuraea gerenzanensis]SBO93622.1 hypothetical protein BN4615_P3136 [Nonomuraea gerenzanensis]
MTQDDIITFVSGLPGTVTFTAGPEIGAPEMAWGDTFFYYEPEGLDRPPADGRLPYATIVTKNYEGFDTASALDRPGVFRLNAAVGRVAFERIIGYSPAAHAEHHAGLDYTVLDQVIPHPLYAAQSWVCVLNPQDEERTRAILTDAHARAAQRHRPASRHQAG